MTRHHSRRAFLRQLMIAAVAGVAWACSGGEDDPTLLSTETSATPLDSSTSTSAVPPSSTTSTVPQTHPPATSEPVTVEPDAVEATPTRVVLVEPGGLQAAVKTALPGDELRLRPGRHRGVIEIAGVSGTAEAPIVLAADDGAQMSQCMLRFVAASDWRIDGLRFEGRLVAAAAIWINDGRSGADAGISGSSRRISVIDCHFVDIRRGERQDTHSIRIDGDASDVLIRGCVSDTSSADAVQIQNATRVVIEDCHFFIKRPFPADDPWDNTGENGIDIKRADDVVVRRCVIEGFQEVDSENIESTSAGAEGIVVHKFGVVGLLVEDCTFRANRTDIKITGRTKIGDLQNVRDYAVDGRWSRDVVIRRCTFVGGPEGHDAGSLGADIAIHVAPGDQSLLRHVGAPARVPEIVVEDCSFEGQYETGTVVERTKQEFEGRAIVS